MRILLHYITRRLLVSALCSGTQTALLAPGNADLFLRHRPAHQPHQVVIAPRDVDVLAIHNSPEREEHRLHLAVAATERDSAAESI